MSEHDFDAEWKAEREKRPGMTKSTFVTNAIFSGSSLDALGKWIVSQPDLHGQVFESTSVCSTFFTEVEGKPGWVQADLSKPHLCRRVQIQVVVDGENKITPSPRGWSEYS